MIFRPQTWRLMIVLIVLAALTTLLVNRINVRTDLSFFLPGAEDPQSALLVDRLQDGAASSIVMISLSGGPAEALRDGSLAVARSLRDSALFTTVETGAVGTVTPQLLGSLWDRRYILSPALDAGAFTADQLRADLQAGLNRLAGAEGWVMRDLFPADPTGRLTTLLASLQGTTGPQRRNGLWMSADGTRALLVARSRAGGLDLPAQIQVASAIDAALAPVRASGLIAEASGPGLIAARTSGRMRAETTTISVIASAGVAILLLWAFRSVPVLVLLGLPIGAAILAGTAVVQMTFGSVHAVALSFGATLIGVAIDYPLHLLAHRHPSESAADTVRRLARPLALSTLTTLAGFTVLSLVSFPGLAQLGLFAAVGIVVAALTTALVLPALTPPTLHLRVTGFGVRLWALLHSGRYIAGAVVLGLVTLALLTGQPRWQTNLAALSALPPAARDLDARLRHDLGVADARILLIVRGDDADTVLARQETLRPALNAMLADGRVGGIEMAADLLPSRAAQKARQARLPDAETLASRLTEATAGLPLRPSALAPFQIAIATEKEAPPLTVETLSGPAALRIEALLKPERGGWSGLVLPSAVADPEALRALAENAGPHVTFLDLKAEAETLASRYLDEALAWLGWGGLAATLVVGIGLRHPVRIVRTLAPASAAIAATIAILVLSGTPLSLFHVLALVLVAGLGIDYAVFFSEYSSSNHDSAVSVRAILLCAATTVTVFSTLALSDAPVLHAIGLTVAVGASLALALTLAFSAADSKGASTSP